MKRLILISAMFAIASSCFAQTECSKSNPIFRQDNYGPPKEVYTLGSNPEFPFLRNLTTSQQVAAAIKKAAKKRGMTELNDMLMGIGFANGTKDINVSHITEYKLLSGTVGNMGDGNFNTAYIKLVGNGQDVKSWKITSPTGCYLYVLAKCGNAFYPEEPKVKPMAAIEVPIDSCAIAEVVWGGNYPASCQKPVKECEEPDHCCHHEAHHCCHGEHYYHKRHRHCCR
jgi:hypothetical protein